SLSPKGLLAVLSASGKPVRNPGNGVLTPRIDAFAATQLASAELASYTGSGVTLPPAGSATATATVSGFTGTLGSVLAFVQVENNDPTQLLVSLAGPDGTSVVLHDHTGQPGSPINAVYGRNGASAFSLVPFQGKQANGTWAVTVQNSPTGEAGL